MRLSWVLLLHAEVKVSCLCYRRSQYAIDSRPLQQPFFDHFTESNATFGFVLSPEGNDVATSEQTTFLRGLRERRLVSFMHTNLPVYAESMNIVTSLLA